MGERGFFRDDLDAGARGPLTLGKSDKELVVDGSGLGELMDGEDGRGCRGESALDVRLGGAWRVSGSGLSCSCKGLVVAIYRGDSVRSIGRPGWIS